MTNGIGKALTAFEARGGSFRTQDRAAQGQDFGKVLKRADEPRVWDSAPSLGQRPTDATAQPRPIVALTETSDRALLHFAMHPEPVKALHGIGPAGSVVETHHGSNPEGHPAATAWPDENADFLLGPAAMLLSKAEYAMHMRSSHGVSAGSPSPKAIAASAEAQPPFAAPEIFATSASAREGKTRPTAYSVRDRLSAALDALPVVLAAPAKLPMVGAAGLRSGTRVDRKAVEAEAPAARTPDNLLPRKAETAHVAAVEAPSFSKVWVPRNVEASTATRPAPEPSGLATLSPTNLPELVSTASRRPSMPLAELPELAGTATAPRAEPMSTAISAVIPPGLALLNPPSPLPVDQPLAAHEQPKVVGTTRAALVPWSVIRSMPREASTNLTDPELPAAFAAESTRPLLESSPAEAFSAEQQVHGSAAEKALPANATSPARAIFPHALEPLSPRKRANGPEQPVAAASAINRVVPSIAFALPQPRTEPETAESPRGPETAPDGSVLPEFPSRPDTERADEPDRPGAVASAIDAVVQPMAFIPLQRATEHETGAGIWNGGTPETTRSPASVLPRASSPMPPEHRASPAAEEARATRHDNRLDTTRDMRSGIALPDNDRSAQHDPGAAPRVEILAERGLPAPASPALSQNAATLTGAIAADPAWRANAAVPLAAAPTLAAVQTLRIQLKPVELGTVTANLRIVGDHLRIEIEVENAEAYHRLSAETETIARTLRGLGFEIDQVTIQAPPSAMAPTLRTDSAMPSPNPASRDNPSLASNHSGSGGDGGAGRETARENRHDGRPGSNNGAPARDRGGDGVYI